jgi:hypothetical protein
VQREQQELPEQTVRRASPVWRELRGQLVPRELLDPPDPPEPPEPPEQLVRLVRPARPDRQDRCLFISRAT